MKKFIAIALLTLSTATFAEVESVEAIAEVEAVQAAVQCEAVSNDGAVGLGTMGSQIAAANVALNFCRANSLYPFTCRITACYPVW